MNGIKYWLTGLLTLGLVTCGIGQTPTVQAAKPVVLLVGQSPDGHPPGTHEYMAGVRLLAQWLEQTGQVSTVVSQGDAPWSEGPELIQKADGVFLFLSQGAQWISEDPRRYEALAQHAQQQKGLSALHWAIGTKDAKYVDAFRMLFGPCHGGPDRKYKFLTTDLRAVDNEHPIANGVGPFRTKGEFYYQLKLPKEREKLVPVLEADIDEQSHAVAYAWTRPDGGRSFVFSGGHFHENWKLIEYRRLVTQGILWSVGGEVPAAGLDIPLPDDALVLPKRPK